MKPLISLYLRSKLFMRAKKKNITLIQNRAAVYFLYDKGKLVYIGQSVNVRQRVRTHRNEKIKVFNSFKILYCAQSKLTAMENLYIHLYFPKYNIHNPLRNGEFLRTFLKLFF